MRDCKTITLTEKRFFKWEQDDVAVTLRNKSGSYGGGSEVLVVSKGCIPLEGNGSRTSHRGDGYGEEGDPMFTLNTTEVHAVCYGISAYDSNAMKPSNPHSGIYEADTSRTLDLNCGNPACNQGGCGYCTTS
jgi:DNA (cytosine-5)-methyltransferase 1